MIYDSATEVFIILMKILRLKEIKLLVQGHTAKLMVNLESEPNSSDSHSKIHSTSPTLHYTWY